MTICWCWCSLVCYYLNDNNPITTATLTLHHSIIGSLCIEPQTQSPALLCLLVGQMVGGQRAVPIILTIKSRFSVWSVWSVKLREPLRCLREKPNLPANSQLLSGALSQRSASSFIWDHYFICSNDKTRFCTISGHDKFWFQKPWSSVITLDVFCRGPFSSECVNTSECSCYPWWY